MHNFWNKKKRNKQHFSVLHSKNYAFAKPKKSVNYLFKNLPQMCSIIIIEDFPDKNAIQLLTGKKPISTTIGHL